MQIGILREIKQGEARVAMTPDGAAALLSSGPDHTVYVQAGAGEMAGYTDKAYKDAGADIIPGAEEVFRKSALIVHVKEPQREEFPLIRKDHILFTFLHLAAEPEVTAMLMEKGCTAFAYETLEDGKGLPLLAPMSKVAGKMAFVYGLYGLQKGMGGTGIYPGAIDGKPMGTVFIIGGGNTGTAAAESFTGIGSRVLIVEKSGARRRELKKIFPRAEVLPPEKLYSKLPDADAVVGAVLVPGAKAPLLISKQQMVTMKPGAVMVDISIDQGGITEASRPTSINEPCFIDGHVIICCVPNIPGTVPDTSTKLLTEATLPYIIRLAEKGEDILKEDHAFRTALNVRRGKCTNRYVAEALGIPYTPVDGML